MLRGGWFASLGFPDPVETVVVGIEQGDIYPYIPLTYDDFHAYLCLPEAKSLDEIDEIMYSAGTTAEAIQTLLANGGFVFSCLDHIRFEIITADESFEAYFPKEDTTSVVPSTTPR